VTGVSVGETFAGRAGDTSTAATMTGDVDSTAETEAGAMEEATD